MDSTRVRRNLLRWFNRSKRDLPWRRSRDAYAIWVSEMMLQQTTVAAVIPYFERFMARFPTIASLANSDEDKVLALWSGLGYYSRARNLRLGAEAVMTEHAGSFPRDPERALSLKGVGRYTANAVTSMAYGAKVAVVDGNVRRVLSRLFAERLLSSDRAQERADLLLSHRSPGTWNEAMMELGATICTPRKPRCLICPVVEDCAGKARPEHWSEGQPRRASIETPVEMALIGRGAEILLVRNPTGTVMAGLLDLPHAGLPSRTLSPKSLSERYGDTLRIRADAIASVRHTVTHHRIEARIFEGRLGGKRLPSAAAFHAVATLGTLPLSGLTRKALRASGVLPGQALAAGGSRSGRGERRAGTTPLK